MNEPLERLYCHEVVGRYGEWKDRYIPVAGSLMEERPEGAWTCDDQWLNTTRLDPDVLHRRWLVGRVTPCVTIHHDLTKLAARLPSFALVGDSGAGKSVALMRLALQEVASGLGESTPAWLPFVVRLNWYSPLSSPLRFLVLYMRQQGRVGFPAHERLAPSLRDRLDAGEMFLLLDGLDDLPKRHQAWAVRRWRSFIRRYGSEGRGNRIVVSTRHLDLVYSLGLPVVSLQPLSDENKRQLLYTYLGDDCGRSLWEQLQRAERRDLLELGDNPFWLERIADVYRLDGSLPGNRGELLATWVAQMRTSGAGNDGSPSESSQPAEDEEDWLPSFAEVVLKLSNGYGESAVVKRSRLKKMLRQRAPELVFDDFLTAGRSSFLETEELLLADRNAQDPLCWFKHEWFQTYFVAEALRRRFDAGKHKLSAWGSATGKDKLRAGRLLRRNAFSPLPGVSSRVRRNEMLLLAGLTSERSGLLLALAKANPLLAGECALENGVELEEGVHRTIVDALVALIADEKTDLKMRILAGDLLGNLGDPRLPETVGVPAGRAVLGRGRSSHLVDVPAFRLFRYPVTREEFSQFVGSGAYHQRDWWTQAGWDWCRSTRQDDTRREGCVTQGRPNHPITGVTWYEAVAYGNWLSSKTGVLHRLPSEAEWEKAARGPTDHTFPWGDATDPSRANTCDFDSLYVFDTTPVGAYPAGAGWYGGQDLAGNVWEWCTSLYLPYPYDLHDGREVLQGDDARVLRGGSWLQPLDRAGCSVRNAELPDAVRPDIGFRLIEVIA